MTTIIFCNAEKADKSLLLHRQKSTLIRKKLWFIRLSGDIIIVKGCVGMPKFSMTKQKFINQWIRHFAKGVSNDMLEKYVKDQFIWHVFSWELIKLSNLLIGDAARQAFDQISKENCLCCDFFGSNGVTNTLLPQYDTAEKIDNDPAEFYVVAEDYSWTYIKTHESETCGPYF